MNATGIIEKLNLKPHPEGGYYAETYRASHRVSNEAGNSRNICTAIYFLLENDNKSNFHRIQSDELWFFHQGAAIEIIMLQDGNATSVILGNDLEKGEMPQATIPAHVWFASKVKDGDGYGLVSCTVSPGFDFADFELADRKELILKFPHLKKLIEEFTVPATQI